MKIDRLSCLQCGKDIYPKLNSKQLCPDCVFKNNHDGKSKFEVYNERKKLKISEGKVKLRNYIKPKRKSLEIKINDIRNKDKEVYYQVFLSKPPFCEECGKRLPEQFEDEDGNIIYIHQYSHIISKGSDQRFRHDIRNFNRLCHEHHHQWEFGDRMNMKILKSNVEIMNKLRSEYRDNK